MHAWPALKLIFVSETDASYPTPSHLLISSFVLTYLNTQLTSPRLYPKYIEYYVLEGRFYSIR